MKAIKTDKTLKKLAKSIPFWVFGIFALSNDIMQNKDKMKNYGMQWTFMNFEKRYFDTYQTRNLKMTENMKNRTILDSKTENDLFTLN